MTGLIREWTAMWCNDLVFDSLSDFYSAVKLANIGEINICGLHSTWFTAKEEMFASYAVIFLNSFYMDGCKTTDWIWTKFGVAYIVW